MMTDTDTESMAQFFFKSWKRTTNKQVKIALEAMQEIELVIESDGFHYLMQDGSIFINDKSYGRDYFDGPFQTIYEFIEGEY